MPPTDGPSSRPRRRTRATHAVLVRRHHPREHLPRLSVRPTSLRLASSLYYRARHHRCRADPRRRPRQLFGSAQAPTVEALLKELSVHLLNNELNNEDHAHCKGSLFNDEGIGAHCCNNEPNNEPPARFREIILYLPRRCPIVSARARFG